jgi:hypothetical protein
MESAEVVDYRGKGESRRSRTMSPRIAGIFVLFAFTAPNAVAQQPAPPQTPEPLPTPRTIVVEPIKLVPLAPLGSRDVWKNFAVDSSGRLRPRVVLAPYDSSFYYYNGAPYPYLPIRNSAIKTIGN